MGHKTWNINEKEIGKPAFNIICSLYVYVVLLHEIVYINITM